MKKYFTQSLVSVLVLICVFAFGALMSATKVSAQTSSTCQTIEALISAGLITPDKANSARIAAGCPTPVTPYGTLDSVTPTSPTVSLIYNTGGERTEVPYLRGNLDLTLTATDGDVYVYSNTTGVFSDDLGHIRSVLASLTDIGGAEIVSDNFGVKVFKIAEGHSARASIVATADTATMFAGRYHYEVPAIMYATDLTSQNQRKLELKAGISNGVLIIGETSPYINSITSPIISDTTMVIKGDRLNKENFSGDWLSIDGTIRDVNNVVWSENQISFRLPDLKPGNHWLQLISPKGNSNQVGFTVANEVVNTPFIKVISPNGGESLIQRKQYSNDYTISWDGLGLSTVFAFLVPADSLDGSGTLGIIGSVSSNYSFMGWDGMTVWTDLHDGKAIDVPPGNYKIYLVGNIFGGKPVTDISDNSFEVVKVITPAPIKPTLKFEQSTPNSSEFSSQTAVLPVGAELLFRWESKYATSCVASSNPRVSTWSGNKEIKGLLSAGKVDVSRTYKLTCTGAGGSVEKTIDVMVQGKPVVVEPTPVTPPTVPVTPTPIKPQAPANTSIKLSEIFCNKGDWVGKDSVIGIWFKKDTKYNFDTRFLCHIDKTIYRCTKDADEAGNASYWNTFSTRIGNGAPTPNYTCDTNVGSWIKVVSQEKSSSFYATILSAFELFINLFN